MHCKSVLMGTAVAAFATFATATASFAGSVTQPGETVGEALGAPLPEGVYFVNTGSIGRRAGSESGVNIPVLAWSTPLQIGGGRIALLAAAPELYVGGKSSHSSGWYNPFLAGMISFDLGGGLGVSYLAGAYIGINGGDFGSGFNQHTFRQDIHVSYARDGWTAAANLIYGIVGDNRTTKAGNPDYFNYDLSLTKAIDKWELGVVAFGSTDVNAPSGTKKQSQFAVGGLVGYNFGPVITQVYVTRDIAQSNYGGYETRAWLRLIVPLGNPFGKAPAPAPVKAVVKK